MPYAVTHVLSAAIGADIWRDYFVKDKKLFDIHHLFVAGISGLLPDIDIPISMALTMFGTSPPELLQHGGITHTPLFGLIFLIPGFILWKKGKKSAALYFYLITFGIFLHIFLDWSLGGGGHYGVRWLFPFVMKGYKLGLLTNLGMDSVPQSLDALFLLGWLWHEEYKHKITDFL